MIPASKLETAVIEALERYWPLANRISFKSSYWQEFTRQLAAGELQWFLTDVREKYAAHHKQQENVV